MERGIPGAHVAVPTNNEEPIDCRRSTNATPPNASVPNPLPTGSHHPSQCATRANPLPHPSHDLRSSASSEGWRAPSSHAGNRSRSTDDKNQEDVHTVISEVPAHLQSLARNIAHLETTDLLAIAEMTQRRTMRDVYSCLPYSGSNWYLPLIRVKRPDEPRWGLNFTLQNGLILFLGGRRMDVLLLNMFVRLAFLVLCWFVLYVALPHFLMVPGGYVFDPTVLVVMSAIVGGILCRILQIPPLVGVLWVSIAICNIPHYKAAVEGIDSHIPPIASKLGLTVILARAGLSLSFQQIRPHWKTSLLLMTLPFALETVAHSFIANKVFSYNNDYNWAFLQGLLCSIVSPAVVVPGTLFLQQLGYGLGVGPLSLLLSCVGIEISAGVWAANFLIGLIFDDTAIGLAIALGPIQLVVGALAGVLLGLAFHYLVEILKNEAYRLPNGKWEHGHFHSTMNFVFAIYLALCFACVFLGYDVKLAGGGSVMCVAFSATIAHRWLRDPTCKELVVQKQNLGAHLAFTWDHIMMPLLFSMMGTKIDIVSLFNKEFFPKALICLVSSTAVRLVVSFLVQLGSGMPWKQKVLVCFGYSGKASAQASIGPIPLGMVATRINSFTTSHPAGTPIPADLLQQQTFAHNINSMSALYVMFMAAIASVLLVRGGPYVLPKTLTQDERREQRHQQEQEQEQERADDEAQGLAPPNQTAAAPLPPRPASQYTMSTSKHGCPPLSNPNSQPHHPHHHMHEPALHVHAPSSHATTGTLSDTESDDPHHLLGNPHTPSAFARGYRHRR